MNFITENIDLKDLCYKPYAKFNSMTPTKKGSWQIFPF